MAAPRARTAKPEGALSIEVEVDGKKKTLSFKPFGEIPIGIYHDHRKDEQDFMFAVFEWALPEQDLDLLRGLPVSKLYPIWNDMQKASNADVGESAASSPS